MSRARENADGARLDAPLASPAFTGTPTGIVTGSMVDGTITAAKVAADVATQAELDAQRTNSSITTLGTVTAGNLSNTAIVYPVGHVLQVASGHLSGEGTTVSSSYQTLCTATFSNPLTAGSEVVILSSAWVSSAWGGCAVTIFRNTTNLASVTQDGSTLGSINSYGGWNEYSFGNGSNDRGESVSISVVDKSPHTIYHLKYASINGAWNPVYYGRAENTAGGYAKGSQNLTIMEIAG